MVDASKNVSNQVMLSKATDTYPGLVRDKGYDSINFSMRLFFLCKSIISTFRKPKLRLEGLKECVIGFKEEIFQKIKGKEPNNEDADILYESEKKF